MFIRASDYLSASPITFAAEDIRVKDVSSRPLDTARFCVGVVNLFPTRGVTVTPDRKFPTSFDSATFLLLHTRRPTKLLQGPGLFTTSICLLLPKSCGPFGH